MKIDSVMLPKNTTLLFTKHALPKKKWIQYFLLSILITIFTISLINILINPYHTFNHIHRFNHIPHHKYSDRIIHFYTSRHIQPNIILMGTSRIGLYNPQDISKYIRGKPYNSSLAGSSIEEQSAYLEYYIKNLNLRHIVWSLDFFSFNPDKTPYPAFTKQRLESSFYIPDYAEAIFNFKTFSVSLKTFFLNFSQKSEIQNLDQPFNEKQIHSNINATIREYKREKMFLNSKNFQHPRNIDKNLQHIRQIVDLCEKHNITLTLYISPVYYKHLEMFDDLHLAYTYRYLKKELVKIHPYFDFGTLNSVTKNFKNFRDSSHTIRSIGTLIFTKIFDSNNTSVPTDFGEFVF